MCSPARFILAVLALAALCFADRPTQTHGALVVIPLHDLVPDCSLRCLDTFIRSNYPRSVCSRRSDINCLCRTSTFSGLTFGEAALRCVLSSCSQDIDSSLGVYNICSSVPAALPKTHHTITATVAPVDSQSSTARPKSVESTTSSLPTTDTTTASSNASSLVSSVTSSSHPSATSDEPSYSPVSSESLNSGAVIGISVASGISVSFIIGVVFFLCCRRLMGRHQKGRHTDSSEIRGSMSEPPELRQPPAKSPSPRLRPYLNAANSEEDQRRPPTPRVATPRSNPDNSRVHETSAQIGIAASSNSEFETSLKSQTPPRTLSGLLPDKPELCPEPLRLSRRRPDREGKLFEEDTLAGRRRSAVASANGWTDSSGSTIKDSRNSPYNRMHMVGLPSSPRALMQGFGRADGAFPSPVRRGQRLSRTLVNRRGMQPSHNATRPWGPTATTLPADTMFGRGHHTAKYSHPGDATRRKDFEQPLARSVASRRASPYFEAAEVDGRQTGGRAPDAGCLRPLTPVKEAGTPANNAGTEARRGYFSNAHFQPGTTNEIVSRPRIVRGDDIRRMQIQRGRPQPRELQVPYSPEDYWREHRGGHRAPGIVGDVSDRSRGRGRGRGRPPLEHNVTPSRRGADLILRVD
jgi:hypothetical protein